MRTNLQQSELSFGRIVAFLTYLEYADFPLRSEVRP
jgi:hypothetical protein